MSPNIITKTVLGLVFSATSAMPFMSHADTLPFNSASQSHLQMSSSLSPMNALTTQQTEVNLTFVPTISIHLSANSHVISGVKSGLISSFSHIKHSILSGIASSISHLAGFFHQGIKTVGSGISHIINGVGQAAEAVTGTINGFLHIGPPLLLGNFPGGNFASHVITSIGNTIASGGEAIAQKLSTIANIFSPQLAKISAISSAEKTVFVPNSIQLTAVPDISASLSKPAQVPSQTISPSVSILH